MARVIALLIALAHVQAEMRETMERMVMVRKSGSDLTPEATGYIYKSDGQGPANIIQLDESEVIKHLETMPALYEQPKVFSAPIPMALRPFQAEKYTGPKETHVIPIVELNGEQESVESFAKLPNDSGYQGDFEKLYESHTGDSGIYNQGHEHESGGGNDYGADHHSSQGESGNSAYGSKNSYGSGDSGHYGKTHYESFHKDGEGEQRNHHDAASAYGDHYSNGKSYKSENHGGKSGHSKDEETTGFHKLYDKNIFKKDHDFYDDSHLGGKFHEYGNQGAHHSSTHGGFGYGGSHDSGYYQDGFGKHGFHDKESVDAHHNGYTNHDSVDDYNHYDADYGSEAGHHDGKQFGYQIHH